MAYSLKEHKKRKGEPFRPEWSKLELWGASMMKCASKRVRGDAHQESKHAWKGVVRAYIA